MLILVFIPKDFRGRCKGYAFIEYENAQDCAAAVEGADRSQSLPLPNHSLMFLECSVVLSVLSPQREQRKNPVPSANVVTLATNLTVVHVENSVTEEMAVKTVVVDSENSVPFVLRLWGL